MSKRLGGVIGCKRPIVLCFLRANPAHGYDERKRAIDGREHLCVCVLCFLPIYFGRQVRWMYQPGSHRRKVTQDFSSAFLFCGPCLYFSREKDSAIPFPRRPWSRILCANDLIVLHYYLVGIFVFVLFFCEEKSQLPGFELTSQLVIRLRGYQLSYRGDRHYYLPFLYQVNNVYIYPLFALTVEVLFFTSARMKRVTAQQGSTFRISPVIGEGMYGNTIIIIVVVQKTSELYFRIHPTVTSLV